ncbi:uncharacterized protein LOC129260655 [Lytechinus pictus]|uniref:uncharacterized protein LOC129260655 n=1 Tax=Lytechinus pictus TaxID=7653 RepID=UPI0030BA1BDE
MVDAYFLFMALLLHIVILQLLSIYASATTVNVTIGENTFKTCTSSSCGNVNCGEVPGDPTPCHCDQACEFYNDCCGDYRMVCSGTNSTESTRGFRETVDDIGGEVNTECISPNADSSDAFWMIQSCPETWHDAVLRNRCTSNESSTNTDLRLLPVVHGGVTYRNIFCAVCNGVEFYSGGLTGWKFEFSCLKRHATFVESENITIHELINSENCEPRFSPPSGVPQSSLRPCLNYNYVAGCPPDSPRTLLEGCMSFTGIFTEESTGRYKNPYCKLCNEGAISKNWTTDEQKEYVERLCSSPGESLTPVVASSSIGSFSFLDESGEPSDNDIGMSLTPISVIVDFSAKSSVSIFYSENMVVERQVACNFGEVYDLTSDGCVAVTCTDGYTLTNGRCVRDAPSVNLTCGNNNANLELSMTVVIATDSNDTCLKLEIDKLGQLSNCIAVSLNLPNESFTIKHQIPQDNVTKQVDNNTNCKEVMHEGRAYTSMEYTFYTAVLDYAELEDAIDRSLLYVYQPAMGCDIKDVDISRRCVAIEGLPNCDRGRKELSYYQFQNHNGTSFVYDNETGNLYHPYETELIATYDSQYPSTIRKFHKKEVVHICDRGHFLSCPLISRNVSYFTTVEGKSNFLRHAATGEILGPDEYMVAADGNIQVCVPEGSGQNATVNETVVKYFFRYDQSQVILSYVGVCMSLVALIATFLTYSTFPVLRQCVSNKLIMILCVALFAAQLLQLLNGIATRNAYACMIVAVIGHFLWLFVFAMTTGLAFELDRTFGSLNNFSVSSDSLVSLLKYTTFALSLAGAIVASCLGIHFTIGEEIDFHYGSETLCWIGDRTVNLIAFGGPLAIFLLFNIILFGHTVHGIRHVTKIRNRAIRHSSTLKERGKELQIYWKISTLLGFTWLFGFVAAFAGVPALWYIFIILNSLQGVYIFLAFMANKRVYHLWASVLCCRTRGDKLTKQGKGHRSNGKSTTLTLVAGTVSTTSEHRIANQFTTWNSSATKV